jgi:SAM-dependent methyltransferase
MEIDTFFREYTSPEATPKYTRATAGFGINYLLDHDYREVYLKALTYLPDETRQRGIRMLEFGCGGGMNLLHLISVLNRERIRVECAIGTDFSPVLIEAAKREANNCLRNDEKHKVEFFVANNQNLINDLSASSQTERTKLKNSFHFIFGVNTIRYCHAAKKEMDCARDILDLLVPGGMCVVIDMNNRYPCFRSDLKNRFRRHTEEECYVPSLEEYTAPFERTGFEVLRSEHFCWVPHSSGQFVCLLLSWVSPILNLVAKSRAMRSLVVSRKPNQHHRAATSGDDPGRELSHG